MISEQLNTFFIYIILGIFIGFLFEIFKTIRKNYKSTDIIIFIQDIIFLIFSSLIILYTIFIINKGIIRNYIILGITLGLILYILTLSKANGIILQNFVRILKYITKKLTSYYNKIKNALF